MSERKNYLNTKGELMTDEEYVAFRDIALRLIALSADPEAKHAYSFPISASAMHDLIRYIDHLRSERIISAHWVYLRVQSMLSARDREILELEWQKQGGAE
jgi:hypothetical protein